MPFLICLYSKRLLHGLTLILAIDAELLLQRLIENITAEIVEMSFAKVL